ncbi:MAG: 2-dehydro-3-deoxyphosphogluconate aldolase [Oscillospiraceae bacterium]|jgi:2-dehydro-3-deoxyphosphogluconate aldolase/(4S)-4-hydroxy-2-oxoglutarate aldolase|nr:2-dehydro-3-deoxyphosphogluconate aldolase [Oscillospiraceae bacterium]
MSRADILRRVAGEKLICIVRGQGEGVMLPLTEALAAGGIRMLEVTFPQKQPERFAETARAIAAVRKAFGGPGGVAVGAGTVLSAAQARRAAEAGAEYIISPNADPAVIAETRRLGLVSMPGAMTPTECAAAHATGADFIKLFPAGHLGPDYLKAIRAPLSHLRFLAVGGIHERNIPDFLAAGAEGFGVGGNLVNREWIAAGEFAKITALARTFVRAARGEQGE